MLDRATVAADAATDARRKAEIARIKAEHARRVAELKTTSTGSHRGLPPAKPTHASPSKDFRGSPASAGATSGEKRDFRGNSPSASGARQTPIPFSAASAPPPADALKSFVAAARSATTMEALLNYLPASEARQLRDCQAKYDPRDAVASRQQLKQLNPSLDEESLTFLTNSPYKNEFDRLKRIAGNILDVISVKVEGNTATLVVSTNSDTIINGGRWKYGKAEIELVGEGNAWKFDKYNDSNLVYQEQPR
jgi:hypothetical protein